MIVFLVGFVILLVIGVPISISIGASAVLGCLSLGYPMVVIGQKMVSGIDSFLLIAIPLFIFAGNLMNAGSITKKIFNTARELVGWIPGGLGHANVIASVIFAGMSGSAVADAGGLGAIPALHSAYYLWQCSECERQQTLYGRCRSGCDDGAVAYGDGVLFRCSAAL